MELYDFEGRSIRKIACRELEHEGIDGTLIDLADPDTDGMTNTAVNLPVRRELFRAPSNCPVALPIIERSIASFAVCLNCPNRNVEYFSEVT